MTSHELAAALLAGPNLPVVINGWGSDEGFTFEVTEISPAGTCSFRGADDNHETPVDRLGYELDRQCLSLWHGKHHSR